MLPESGDSDNPDKTSFMKIALNEFRETERKIELSPETDWALAAVLRADEQEPDMRPAPEDRKLNGHLSIVKIDGLYCVSGDINTEAFLLCSRCGMPVTLPVHPQFSMLFTTDSKLDEKVVNFDPTKLAAVDPQWGFRATDDFDITFLQEDFIDLSALINEQIQLALPFQPLCQTQCKGVCTSCGTNLNAGPCACPAKTKPSPFAQLATMKISNP